MPVLLANAIEDSTDIFGISGGGLNPLGTPLLRNGLESCPGRSSDKPATGRLIGGTAQCAAYWQNFRNMR